MFLRGVKKRNEKMDNENDENTLDVLDSSSSSSLLLPTINDNNFLNNHADFKEDFLRLTSMVRRVYFSYLHKSLLSNYAISCQSKDAEDFDSQIKTCASQMELFAVRSALETSLYRKAMTKLISEVKEHTKEQKLHKNLTSFFISPPEKADVAVQTDEVESIKTEKLNMISKSLNCIDHNNLSEHHLSSVTIKTEPLSSDFNMEVDNFNFGTQPFNHLNLETQPPPNNLNVETLENSRLSFIPDSGFQSQTLDETQSFGKSDDQSFLDESAKSKLDDSQDSLFQTMEDMFCESDDSNDIMTLIEKHSSAQSENPGLKSTPKPAAEVVNNSDNKSEQRGHKRKNISMLSSSSSVKSTKRDLSSSPVGFGFNELKGARYKKKVDEIWLVERVNQVTKLKTTMMEISLLDYRKYGRIKAKFLELFGDADVEDSRPDSPVCIEEHLQACKERIAPWIVKHLTPFYKHKRISSRELFKTICRHATDMLIISDTFPEESSVENYMRDFFKNKKSIKTEADIYL